ncbi:Signal recognition particle receptor FtsY [Candidatus Erwinia haradaeae]|uniref:Signal recognition particle receptor FtsY n=1 Tax=Candidatus Erwinia haradaeae TaxID=1922217 RepID=A0A451D7J1_9GAMM|nr:signal recognition particle-docking protein FtsY [Candidatus Erwinia haradaeae]VFP81777.1 Signal recognition particle receptor FtsY [Candidatus Erwinia haradaeae]
MFKNKQSRLLKWISLRNKKCINPERDVDKDLLSFKDLDVEHNQDKRLYNNSKNEDIGSFVTKDLGEESLEQQIYCDLQSKEDSQRLKTSISSSSDVCFQTEIGTKNSVLLENNTKGSDASISNQDELFNNSFLERKRKQLIQDDASSLLEPDQIKNKVSCSKVSFFNRLKSRLNRTRSHLGIGFSHLFCESKIDESLFEQLEEKLLLSDVGVETTQSLINSLKTGMKSKKPDNREELYVQLKNNMKEILSKVEAPLNVQGKMPFVLLMIGVNGAGKTTTIGKLAKKFQTRGQSVILAAGDTFRAGAIDQIKVWGERNDIAVVSKHIGSDSASVIYDTIKSAQARQIDVLIADTAGRLQNNTSLIQEVKKIIRVIKKVDITAPHEIMLIIDASTGQNAISQTKLFHENLGVTGITLTKLDSTAKGGVIFTLADQFKIPIRYIGIGEEIEDLRDFRSEDFIEALFL